MDKEIFTFGNNEIEKKKRFYRNKTSFYKKMERLGKY